MSWKRDVNKIESLSGSSAKKRLALIDFNSPVILSLFFVSLLLVIINSITGGAVNWFLGCRFTRWTDPLMYVRLFTHVLAHGDLAHFAGNYLLLLVVGPMLEEKYGSRGLIGMFAITAGVTGLINIIFFRHIMLFGASGLVFMAILLASFTNIKNGKLPVTVLLVGILYIGREVVNGLSEIVGVSDGISQMGHIVGGLCGAVFGFEAHILKTRNKTL